MVFDTVTYYSNDFTVSVDCKPLTILPVQSLFTFYVPIIAPSEKPAVLASFEYFQATSNGIVCPVLFSIKNSTGGEGADSWLTMNNTDMVGIIRVDDTQLKSR